MRLPQPVRLTAQPKAYRRTSFTEQLRARLAACTTPDEVLQNSLILQRESERASAATRGKWSRMAQARLEELERERTRPSREPLIVLAGAGDSLLVREALTPKRQDAPLIVLPWD